MGSNQFTGQIPSELASLSNLEVLALSSNQLTGPIPTWLASLTNLRELYLGRNQFTGQIPSELASLSNLERLSLSGNQLTGSVPSWLGSLTNLEELYLWAQPVHRTDTLPVGQPLQTGTVTGTKLGQPVDRTYSDMAGQPHQPGVAVPVMTGQIPSELASLTKLERLSLSDNQLTGVPSWLGSLTNLEELYLSENQLSGMIPPELGNLTDLQRLRLSENQLTGIIPAELGNFADLEELFLSGNQLTGCIPSGVWGVANNDLDQLALPFCAGVREGPTIIAVTPEAGALTIEWAAPADLTVASAIVAYDLRYIESAASDKADANWTVVDDAWTAGSGALRYHISGLTNGTRYEVQVRAVTAAGDWPWSTTVAGATAAPAIVFSDLSWLSAMLQNHIARYIVENGYGNPTNLLPGPSQRQIQNLRDGDSHVMMEIWLPQPSLAWEEALASGEALSLGASLGNHWQSAFVIPAYLQTQYPDLDSVEDLKDQRYKDLFMTAETGGKARLVSCVVGWACEKENADQIEGYGLADHIHIVNPNSGSALDASLYDAYERQEPWLGFQWGTNGPALLLDLVRLEEPEYSDECWSTTRACAYEESTILIGVNSSLPDLAPDVVEFLRQWDFSIDVHLRNVFRWQDSNPGASLEDAALYWLGSNTATWSGWVTGDATSRILATLPAVSECSDAVPNAASNPGLVSDCGALLAARDTLAGTGTLNWSGSTAIGSWDGVTLGGSPPRVTKLVLRDSQLAGTIPLELGSLANLVELDLGDNRLTGPIPSALASLTNLEILSLTRNQLSGSIPPGFSGLTSLEILALGGNQLAGPIPTWMGNLTNLQGLYLWGNQLTGPIPSQLASLTKLERLSLWDNQLSGPVPTWLGSLTNLEWLYLSENRWLYLSENRLTGPVPPELGSLTNLQRLRLSDNQLTGMIPTELGSLTNLEELFLSGNRLTGCIPSGIAGVANNDLDQLALPFCAGASGAPTMETVTPGADFLTVTWTAARVAGGTAITAYDLRYIESAASDKSDANWSIVDNAWTTGSGALSYQISGLTSGTQYDVQVRVVTAAGDGRWSAAVAGTPATWAAIRSFSPPSVGPGGQVVATIAASGFGPFGQVTETLPPGFDYVASSQPDTSVTVDDRKVSFFLIEETSFTYTVTAPSAAGTYSFSGVLTNSDGQEVPVGGALMMRVGGLPSISVSRAAGSEDTKVRPGSPVSLTATFSRPVSGFTIDDITVGNGAVSNFAGSGAVHTFDVTPNAIGEVTVDIAAGVAQDADGNGNAATPRFSLGITYDDDDDGGINKAEAIAAIRDYFKGLITKAQAIAVIRLYFAPPR